MQFTYLKFNFSSLLWLQFYTFTNYDFRFAVCMLLFAGLRENPAEEELQPIALLSCKPDTATPPRVCSQSCSSLSKHCCWCLQVHPGTLCWQSRALHHLTASEAPVEPVEAVTPVDWQTNNTPAKLAGQLFYEELTMPVCRVPAQNVHVDDEALTSARRGTRSTWDQYTMASWCHKEEWSMQKQQPPNVAV